MKRDIASTNLVSFKRSICHWALSYNHAFRIIKTVVSMIHVLLYFNPTLGLFLQAIDTVIARSQEAFSRLRPEAKKGQ